MENGTPAPHLELTLPADPRSARTARGAIRTVVEDLVDESTAEEIELLVTELVTNSVRHGSPRAAKIAVDLTVGRSDLTVAVEDCGGGFDPASLPGAERREDGGWGLALVSHIAERWGTRKSADRFAVWFTIRRQSAA